MKYNTLLILALISTFSYGQVNYLNFDGANDFVEIQHHADLNFDGDFTVEMKFKRERDGIREDLMDKKKIAAGTSSYNDLAITINSSDRIVLWFKESDMNLVLLTSTTIIEVGEWYHVASVREGSTVRLYVNGVLEATGSFFGNLVSNGPMRIGSNRTINADPNSSPIFPFDGGIDEIRIWSIARSSDQIFDYINEEISGDELGLERYYKLNQGFPCGDNMDITYAIDFAHGINGTLINFALSGSGGDPCTSNWVGRNGGQNDLNEFTPGVLRMYPNPTQSRVILIFDREFNCESFYLYDTAGNLCLIHKVGSLISEMEIDLVGLSDGQYLIFSSTNEQLYFIAEIQKY